MNDDERRVHKRVPVKVPAVITLKNNPGTPIPAEVLDISEGGAFVHGSVPIELGEEVTVEISFTDKQLVDGKVVRYSDLVGTKNVPKVYEASVVKWARGSSRTGFGIEFLNPSKETLGFIRKLIEVSQAPVSGNTKK